MGMLSSLIDPFRALSRNAQLYLMSNSIQAVTAGALIVIYTLYLTALGYNAGFIGLLAVVGTFGGALGIVPSQFLVNRFGWRTMLIWSDMIGGVAIFLAANSTTRDRTALYGLNNALQFLASILGTLLAGFLPAIFTAIDEINSLLLHVHIPLLATNPQARAYQLTLLVMGALAIPSIIPILFLHEAPREHTASEPRPAHPWRERLD